MEFTPLLFIFLYGWADSLPQWDNGLFCSSEGKDVGD